MILGIGIDLIAQEKIAEGVRREAYRRRVFTAAEVAECEAAPDPLECFAGKFAVKEAFMKAIGAGIRQQVWFTDIEVRREASGRPKLQAFRDAGRILETLGATRVHVSISHSAGLAIGMVVLEG